MASEKVEIPVTERPIDESSSASAQNDQTGEASKAKTDKSFGQRVSAFFGDWYYLWEVVGILISGLAIVGICIVVKHFDGKEPPNWVANVPGRDDPFRLTINSLLSILSVLGSTCAMIPVTKGLGQLKYLWFMGQDRKLADLEVFDAASRGKMGAAQLIWKLRLKHLAVLGGLASLLALAYGPFVQNLIVIEIAYTPAGNTAKLSYANTYSFEPENGTGIDRAMAFAMGQAIEDKDGAWTVPPNQCLTGQCEWKDYYTMGACARCTDITDKLERACAPYSPVTEDTFQATGGCALSLPNGVSTNGTQVSSAPGDVLFVMNATAEPLVYDYDHPLATVQCIMALDKTQLPTSGNRSNVEPYLVTEDTQAVAHECALIPCMQRQSLTLRREDDLDEMARGVSTNVVMPVITIKKTWENFTYGYDGAASSENPDAIVDFPMPADGMTQEQLDRWSSAVITGIGYKGLRQALADRLAGEVYRSQMDWTAPFVMSTKESNTWAGSIFNNSYSGWLGSALVGYCDPDVAIEGGFECAMQNLAAGITNGMRVAAWEQTYDDRLAVTGLTYEPAQFCTAQWQYISAPIAVWVLGLALFAGVVWKTRRANIKAWRTSPLATLLLRLDPETRERLEGWQHMGDNELRDTAEALRLRLQVDDNGPPRFVKPGEAV